MLGALNENLLVDLDEIEIDIFKNDILENIIIKDIEKSEKIDKTLNLICDKNTDFNSYLKNIFDYKNIKYDNNDYVSKNNNYFSSGPGKILKIEPNSMINGYPGEEIFKITSNIESNLALNGFLIFFKQLDGNIKKLTINGVCTYLEIIPNTIKEITINGDFSYNLKIHKNIDKLVINGGSISKLEIPKTIKTVIFNGYEIKNEKYLDSKIHIAKILCFENEELKETIEINKKNKLNFKNFNQNTTEIIILGNIQNLLFSFPSSLKNLIIQGNVEKSVFLIPNNLKTFEFNGSCDCEKNHFIFESKPKNIQITLIGKTRLYYSDMDDHNKIKQANNINDEKNFIKKIMEPHEVRDSLHKKCKVNKKTTIVKGNDGTLRK
jgi:hypothetical protein